MKTLLLLLVLPLLVLPLTSCANITDADIHRIADIINQARQASGK